MVKRYHTDEPKQWLAHVAELRQSQDISLLQNAIGLYDNEQSPLLKKGIIIADVLLNLGLDNETLASALLYPALQSHEMHLDTIIDCLGESCRKLLHDVLQMQSLEKLHNLEIRSHQVENLRKMLLAMVTDIRAVLIILAEKLWQLHQVKNSSEKEQKALAQEALDVFAPLANRLGVWQIKWELEDLALRYLQPEVYSKIAKWLATRRQEREAYIHRVIHIVKEMLTDAELKNFQVTGRVKHIYSIYRKMQRKSASFDEIYDVSAIRILVESIPDCYTVLGLLQDKWHHIPEEFDDYISQPKPNSYRSLHTVVIGPENHFVEIQIRTFQMHQESELGMSAHWQYKEGVLQPSSYEAKIALLRQVIDWQKEVVSHENKTEKQIQDLFADRVYVFTPTGDIVDLPKGATPLDFAYHIHSEVGHRCRGAKVNGNIVSLKYALQTGERVEILTTKQANPSRDWLNMELGYLKTPRARAKVAHFFRTLEGMQDILTGRELLEKELKKIGYNEKLDLHALAGKLNYKSSDELLTALGSGEIRLAQIIHLLRPQPLPLAIPTPSKTTESTSSIQISGIDNLLTQIARCCKPLPGDPIVGYVTRTRGVSIHRRECNNILNIAKENQTRLIEVNWGDKVSRTYSVDLQLRVYDRTGLLRDITTVLASEKINLLGLQTYTDSHTQEANIYLIIEISNRDQLKKALELLHKVPNVIQARRR